jgi:hypothetical protein
VPTTNANSPDTCWPNSLVLGGEVLKQEYNAGLCGEYTRTDTICDGAPVYVHLDAWHKPFAAKTETVDKTKYPAYFFRRNIACHLLPPLMQELTRCNIGGPITSSAWLIAHENPDAAATSFDCTSIEYANAVSVTGGDCAANPISVGCDGHWRECLDASDCPVETNPELSESLATSTLGCAFGHVDDTGSCQFASSPGLLFVSGRERDMALSVAQQLQMWHWLAILDNGDFGSHDNKLTESTDLAEW